MQRQRHKHGQPSAASNTAAAGSSSTTSISLTETLSRPYAAKFSSQNVKPAKLTLTPHHLFYLLSKFEDLGVDVGPMNVRLENLHNDTTPSNYVSFLGHAPRSRGKQADSESVRSVSSVRSMMSSVSSLWSTLTLSNSAAKAEKQMMQHREDIKYLYSCFTKIPALKLAPDHRARLITGFEEFPFDTAVPLFAFKNLMSLDICDLDFRQFHGWDRLAEQLRSLTVKRGGLDDPMELLQNIVLDDMEKRRKRSSKSAIPTTPSTPGAPWPSSGSPRMRQFELARSLSTPNSPLVDQRRASLGSPQSVALIRGGSADGTQTPVPSGQPRQRSNSPVRPPSSRHGSLHKPRRSVQVLRRSSGSSGSDGTPRHSNADLLADVMSSKWQFLRHLSLADNGLTYLNADCFKWAKNSLQSLDLSGNLFTEIPDALASLEHLRALNLSNCMIDSLKSLARNPLPAITTLNLRSNRLLSLAGIERILTLERIDVRDNKLHDPTELARLNGMLEIVDIYVVRNPFTRTHSNYRIAIFNEFRKTPGRTEDVTIDTLGPAYSEKKLLRDWTPELAPRPVVQPPPEESPEIAAKAGAEMVDEALPPPALEQPQLPPYLSSHRRTTSDFGPQMARRRRKAPRKRIVELSQAESMSRMPAEMPSLQVPPRTPTDHPEPTTPTTTPYHTAPTTQIQQTASTPQRPTLATAFSTPTPVPRIRDPSDDDDSPVKEPQELESNSDLYRQKIEALKSELGPNWLSALKEESLVEQQTRNRSFSPNSRTSGKQRPEQQSPGVSVGGRTLG